MLNETHLTIISNSFSTLFYEVLELFIDTEININICCLSENTDLIDLFKRYFEGVIDLIMGDFNNITISEITYEDVIYMNQNILDITLSFEKGLINCVLKDCEDPEITLNISAY